MKIDEWMDVDRTRERRVQSRRKASEGVQSV